MAELALRAFKGKASTTLAPPGPCLVLVPALVRKLRTISPEPDGRCPSYCKGLCAREA